MNFKKTIFLLSLFGILLLIILSQNLQETKTSTISNIYYSSEKTTIITENNQTLIIFEESLIDLKKGNKIRFQGKEELYKGKSQIIVSKLWKINL